MNHHQTWNAGWKTGQKAFLLPAPEEVSDIVESQSDGLMVAASRFKISIKGMVVLPHAPRRPGTNTNVSPHLPYLLWILLDGRVLHDGRPFCLRSHGGRPEGVAITTIHDEKMDSMLTHFCIQVVVFLSCDRNYGQSGERRCEP